MNKLPRPSFGIRLLSTLLCIVLFLSMFAGILIADIRIATTKENTSKIIREALFISHTVRPTSLRSAATSGHGSIIRVQPKLATVKLAEEDTAGIMTDALVEFVYNSMSEQYGELPITLEDVEEFIEESTLKDEIADLSASLVNDLITGENTTVIDEEMITDVMMDNADLIETYFGVTMNEEEVSQMAEALVQNEVVEQLQEQGIAQVLMDSMAGGSTSGDNDSAQDNNNNDATGATGAPGETVAPDSGDNTTDGSTMVPGDISGTTNAIAELSQLLQTVRTALSNTAMIVCFGIAAICIMLLIALNRKWIWYPLRRIGFTLIYAALPLLIPTIMVLAMADVWTSLFLSMAIAGTVTAMILTMTAPVCLGIAGAGVVLIITSFILKAVAKKRLASTKAESTGAIVTADIPTPEEPEVKELETAEEGPAEEAEEKKETQEDVINDIRQLLNNK